MRTQLAEPNEHVVSARRRSTSCFTMHGVTMIFFVVIPMQIGAFGNYLVPLMIGARDMAFPRLNALSYWLFLASGLFLYAGVFSGHAPNAGWFNYVPLALKRVQPRLEHRLLRARADLHRHLDDARRDQLRRHDLQAPRARDVAEPDAALLLRDPRDVVLADLRAAVAHGRPRVPRAAAQGRLPLLRRRRTAATRCSGSTSSGSSGTPRSTSSCCPRSGSRRRSSRPSRAGRCSRSRSSRSPSCSSRSSASASGRTTCSRRGCRLIAVVFFAAASMMVVIPSDDPGVRLALTVDDGPAAVQGAVPVHRRLHRVLRARRAVRDHRSPRSRSTRRRPTRTSSSRTSTSSSSARPSSRCSAGSSTGSRR